MDDLADRIGKVLAAHQSVVGFYDRDLWRKYACSCGWWSTADQEPDFRNHVVGALALLIAAERAEAWEEGRRCGSSRAMRHMSDEPHLPLASEADNPYRAATR